MRTAGLKNTHTDPGTCVERITHRHLQHLVGGEQYIQSLLVDHRMEWILSHLPSSVHLLLGVGSGIDFSYKDTYCRKLWVRERTALFVSDLFHRYFIIYEMMDHIPTSLRRPIYWFVDFDNSIFKIMLYFDSRIWQYKHTFDVNNINIDSHK